MTLLVQRPDLSTRSAQLLSKSALTAFDICGHRSWYGIHDPRPWVANPEMVFGSVVDAAVEVVGKSLRNGEAFILDEAMLAAEEVAEQELADVDMDEVRTAVHRFGLDVAPEFDWRNSAFQASVRVTLDDLGECDGHPDVIFGDNGVFDVKTGKKAFPATKAAESLELAFYALLVEGFSGQPVPRVGYLRFIRGSGKWQTLVTPVTDEMRRWAKARALAFVRARKADAVLNAKAEAAGVPPENWTFPSGPSGAWACDGCPWNPATGGPCVVAQREVELVA